MQYHFLRTQIRGLSLMLQRTVRASKQSVLKYAVNEHTTVLHKVWYSQLRLRIEQMIACWDQRLYLDILQSVHFVSRVLCKKVKWSHDKLHVMHVLSYFS